MRHGAGSASVPLPRYTVVCEVSRVRASQHPAIPVLDYLARCERAATARNLREWERHYRDGWRFLFEAVYGAMPLPFLHHDPLPYCPPEKPQTLKPWEIDKYSRPMRRVIRRFAIQREGEATGHSYTVTMLELACGHIAEELQFWDTNKPARRRRCSQCARDAHTAHVIDARRRAVVGGA